MNNFSDRHFDSSDVNVGTSVFLTFASFCFFAGLQFYIAGQLVPRELKKLSSQWKWINIMVSFSHSFLMTVLLASSFYLYPEMLTDPLTFHNSYINAIICFTTGYFMWDTYDMAQSGNLLELWEVAIHHVAVLSNLVYNLSTYQYLPLSMIALTVEANSIFLHARKLLQISGLVNFSSWIYVKVCQVNLLTFVTFRGTVLIIMTWALYHHFNVLTTSYINILGSTLLTSWPMNVVLLWRLVKSDILRNMNNNNNIKVNNNKVNNNNVNNNIKVNNNNVNNIIKVNSNNNVKVTKKEALD